MHWETHAKVLAHVQKHKQRQTIKLKLFCIDLPPIVIPLVYTVTHLLNMCYLHMKQTHHSNFQSKREKERERYQPATPSAPH